MTKAERSAVLKKRLQAIAIIKNIRKTRRYLASHPFDAQVYNALNRDSGMDDLVGRTVIFESLDEHERLQLRKEINAKLDQSEHHAADELRSSSVEYFSDLRKIVEKASVIAVTDKILTDLDSTRAAALEAFDNYKLSAGALDYERSMSTLEHLAEIADSLESTVLFAEAELEKEEYTEEQHEDDDDLPEEEDDDLVPDDPLGDKDEGDDDDDEDDGSDEDETSSVDVDWIESEEAFRESAKLFALPIEATTSDAEFTAVKAKNVLAVYARSMSRYINGLQKLQDTVAAESATVDQLLRGNLKFYKRIDKIIDFANSIEFLRDALDKSCTGLIKASHEMLLQTTRDPML